MTAQFYSVVEAKRGKFPCWKLLDDTGRICGEVSNPEYIGDLIAAKQMAAILVENSAKVGQLIEQHARYQCAEDEFNDDLLV